MNLVVQVSLLIVTVILGGFIVEFFNKSNKKTTIKILLSFGGGFLLAISFVHFLPELYHKYEEGIGLYVLIGFLIQLFLEYFSGGIEHGHIHHHHSKKFPLALFLSLSIHSIIEGIPLVSPQSLSHHHGENNNALLLGILFHQVPVAIALMTLFKEAHFNAKKAWFFLILFALMTPFGLFIGFTITDSALLAKLDYLLAIVIGMLLHISTTIIFESSENHKINLMKLSAIVVGISVAMMVH